MFTKSEAIALLTVIKEAQETPPEKTQAIAAIHARYAELKEGVAEMKDPEVAAVADAVMNHIAPLPAPPVAPENLSFGTN